MSGTTDNRAASSRRGSSSLPDPKRRATTSALCTFAAGGVDPSVSGSVTAVVVIKDVDGIVDHGGWLGR